MDTVDIRINNPPTSMLDGDQTVRQGKLASLISTSSDTDGFIEFYQWTQLSGPSVDLSGINTAPGLSFTPYNTGTYQYRLTVTDNGFATHSDDITIIVNGNSKKGGGVDILVVLFFTVAYFLRRQTS